MRGGIVLLVLSSAIACSPPRGRPIGVTNTPVEPPEPSPFATIAEAFGAPVVTEESPAPLRAQAEAVARTLDEEPEALQLPSDPDALAAWLRNVARWHGDLEARAEAREDPARCDGCTPEEVAVHQALVALEHLHLLRGLLEPPVEGHVADAARGPIHRTLERQIGRLSPGTVEGVIARLARCREAADGLDGEAARAVGAWCAASEDEWRRRHVRMSAPSDAEVAIPGPVPEGPAECWSEAPPVEDVRPQPEDPPEPRAVVAWYSGLPFRWVGPFDAREQARLRDAVYRWLDARLDVPLVDLRTVRRWEERYRAGRSAGDPACAARPASQEQAFYDAEPAAWLFEIAPSCGNETCKLEIRTYWGVSRPPDALARSWRAELEGDAGDVDAWVAAVERLEPIARLEEYDVLIGPAEPLRVTGVRAFGAEDLEALAAAFEEAVGNASDALRGCVPSDADVRVQVAMGLAASGRPRFVRLDPWGERSADVDRCLTRALGRLRLPTSEDRDRRITAHIELGRTEPPPEDPRAVYGRRLGDVRVRLRQLDSPSRRVDRARPAREAAREAIASCFEHVPADDSRVRRVTGTLEVAGTGHVRTVELDGDDDAFTSCVRESLQNLAFPCPELRTPQTVALDACAFRDPSAIGTRSE